MSTLLYIFSNWAIFLARIFLAYVLISHGWPKLKDFKGTAGWMQQTGFKPGTLFAALAVLVEFFGGIALLLGFLTQLVALGIVVQFLILTIWKIATKKPLVGGFELDLMILSLALLLLTVGPGPYAVDNVLFVTGY